MFRSPSIGPGDDSGVGVTSDHVSAAGRGIGEAHAITGLSQLRSGSAVQINQDDLVFQGGLIATEAGGAAAVVFNDDTSFNFSCDGRLIPDEFAFGLNGRSNFIPFRLNGGAFSFAAGRAAETGGSGIETLSEIRGPARRGGMGILTFTAVTFALVEELQAWSLIPTVPEGMLDFDLLTWKAFLFGTYVIDTPLGQFLMNDPEQSLRFDRGPGGLVAQTVQNSPARMVELLAAAQVAITAFVNVQNDPIVLQQRADVQPTSGAGSGSGTYQPPPLPPSVITNPPPPIVVTPVSDPIPPAPVIIPPPIPVQSPPPPLLGPAPTVVLVVDSGAPGDLVTNDSQLDVTPSPPPGGATQFSTDGGQTWNDLSAFAPVEGANTVLIRQVDAAGNPSEPTSFSFTFDDIAPSPPAIISVTDNVGPGPGNLISGDRTNDSDLTIAVNLVGTGALAGDTIQLFDGSGTGSPLGSPHVLTAAEVLAGTVTLQTGALSDGATYGIHALITDVAGNQSDASGAFAVTVDTSSPTVVVDILDSSLSDGHPSSVVTFSFSEVPSGFGNEDLTVLGGTLSLVTPDTVLDPTGKTYTATFTATNGFDGTGSVSVTAGAYSDAAGNLGGAGSDSVTIDRANPTVGVNIVDSSLNDADPSSVVTFTFSEVPSGFGNEDLIVLGGTLSAVTPDTALDPTGKTYTATFTATNGFAGTGAVALVTAGGYTDAAGNVGSSGFDTVAIDRANPTVVVDILDSFLNDTDPSSAVTFKFSEVPSGFGNEDLIVLGGTLSAVAQDTTLDPTGKTYTATFTANDEFAGTGAVALVTAGGYTDPAGNVGSSGFDTVAIDRVDIAATLHSAFLI